MLKQILDNNTIYSLLMALVGALLAYLQTGQVVTWQGALTALAFGGLNWLSTEWEKGKTK